MIELVNYFMDEGWMPVGNMVIHEVRDVNGELNIWFYQPMVKMKDWPATPSDDAPVEWKWEKPKD